MKVYNIVPINRSVSFGEKTPIAKQAMSELRVFTHHIYEYKKGIRNLILTTEKSKYKNIIEDRLKKENIPYKIDEIGNNKINVYFGAEECINVVKTFNSKLYDLTAEQDFMLGIMLGYDRVKQCTRYTNIKNGKIKLGKQPLE